MASFVLVHGSGQNAGCWSRVGNLLRARGHEVAAPDLPKRAADRGLEEHAEILGHDAIDITAGHCPQVSRPEETAKLLERLELERCPAVADHDGLGSGLDPGR